MARKSRYSFHKKYSFLAISGFLLVIFGVSYLLYQKTVVSFSIDARSLTQPISAYPKPVFLDISSLHVAVRVTEASIHNGVWETSPSTVSHLTYSKSPGEGGNIILYAHNSHSLFARLPDIKIGDTLVITRSDGKKYYYSARETSIVTPEQVESVLPTDQEVLTVYTCTGFLDTKRFIVRATPLFSL